MKKQIFLTLTAFFKFYYYVITRNKDKKRSLLLDPKQAVASAVTPLLMFVVGVFFVTEQTAGLFFPLSFAITLGNILYVMFGHHVIHQEEADKSFEDWMENRRQREEEIRRFLEEEMKRQRYAQQRVRPSINNNMANAMKLLGLQDGFTEKDAKSAYRKLSKVHHPDVAGGSEENFKRLNKAYKYVLENI